MHPTESPNIRGGHAQARPSIKAPLTYSGSLDSFNHTDLTPVIGREYTGLQIAQVLDAKDRDRLIKDIAITGMHIWIVYVM
jgi:hypothetical protein